MYGIKNIEEIFEIIFSALFVIKKQKGNGKKRDKLCIRNNEGVTREISYKEERERDNKHKNAVCMLVVFFAYADIIFKSSHPQISSALSAVLVKENDALKL